MTFAESCISVYMQIMREYKQQFSEIDAMALSDLLTILITKAKIDNADVIHTLDELTI